MPVLRSTTPTASASSTFSWICLHISCVVGILVPFLDRESNLRLDLGERLARLGQHHPDVRRGARHEHDRLILLLFGAEKDVQEVLAEHDDLLEVVAAVL